MIFDEITLCVAPIVILACVFQAASTGQQRMREFFQRNNFSVFRATFPFSLGFRIEVIGRRRIETIERMNCWIQKHVFLIV